MQRQQAALANTVSGLEKTRKLLEKYVGCQLSKPKSLLGPCSSCEAAFFLPKARHLFLWFPAFYNNNFCAHISRGSESNQVPVKVGCACMDFQFLAPRTTLDTFTKRASLIPSRVVRSSSRCAFEGEGL